MSILIKDMEMPTSCDDCPLGDSLHCQVLPSVPALWAEYTNAIREKRLHNDCPLIPVPPHGDLIDRDWTLKKIRPWSPEDEYAACTFDTVKKLMHTLLNDSPTIIPAEEDTQKEGGTDDGQA